MKSMVKLKWMMRKASEANGTKYIVWTCVQAGIKIVKYEDIRKYIFRFRHGEIQFRKWSTAKQVAQLIYNG